MAIAMDDRKDINTCKSNQAHNFLTHADTQLEGTMAALVIPKVGQHPHVGYCMQVCTGTVYSIRNHKGIQLAMSHFSAGKKSQTCAFVSEELPSYIYHIKLVMQAQKWKEVIKFRQVWVEVELEANHTLSHTYWKRLVLDKRYRVWLMRLRYWVPRGLFGS